MTIKEQVAIRERTYEVPRVCCAICRHFHSVYYECRLERVRDTVKPRPAKPHARCGMWEEKEAQ